MPFRPARGSPAPADGALPASAAVGAGRVFRGVRARAVLRRSAGGYCDFTTYTAAELGGGATRGYAAHRTGELDLAVRVLNPGRGGAADRRGAFLRWRPPPPCCRGRTSPAAARRRDRFGWHPAPSDGEANPDSVTRRSLEEWPRPASPGCRSHAVGGAAGAGGPRPHPRPAPVADAVGWARGCEPRRQPRPDLRDAAGDARRVRLSLDAALECEPDHVSAYALVVEPGTRFGARVRRGRPKAPDEDDLAEKYGWRTPR